MTLFGANVVGSGTLENGGVGITVGGTGYFIPANVIKTGAVGPTGGSLFSFSAVVEPTAGSQLNTVTIKSKTEGKAFGLSSPYFSIQELVRPNNNNGTS